MYEMVDFVVIVWGLCYLECFEFVGDVDLRIELMLNKIMFFVEDEDGCLVVGVGLWMFDVCGGRFCRGSGISSDGIVEIVFFECLLGLF